LLFSRLLFSNVFVKFQGKHYHQRHGFPMGSALSPEAANFFMGVIESLCGGFKVPPFDKLATNQGLTCYAKGRYIDDYCFNLAGPSDDTLRKVNELMQSFTTILRRRSGLNLELCIRTEYMDFLDVHVYKPEEFIHSGKLAYRTHQKAGNKCQYLHRKSLHPPHVLTALIKGELTRYCITCSTNVWYLKMA
jgi:hypothetical protein